MIQGKLVTLIPATLADRRRIFDWLTASDITSSMLGPPDFPGNPPPTWEEYDEDYVEYFFTDRFPQQGRCFLIEVNGEAVGQINYNDIDLEKSCVEFDIWMREKKVCGKGYGPDAIDALCSYVKEKFGCRYVILAPSARNAAAIRAYEKAGFRIDARWNGQVVPDYHDTVVMVREV